MTAPRLMLPNCTAVCVRVNIRNSLSTHCGRHSNQIEQIQHRTKVHYLLCLAWPRKIVQRNPCKTNSLSFSFSLLLLVCLYAYSFPYTHLLPVNQPNNVIHGSKIKRYNLCDPVKLQWSSSEYNSIPASATASRKLNQLKLIGATITTNGKKENKRKTINFASDFILLSCDEKVSAAFVFSFPPCFTQ